MTEYRIATRAEFDALWDRNTALNPDEPMWPIWRQRFRGRIDRGQAITFTVIVDGEPVGEGTLELDTGKDPRLCDGKSTAYLSALRIRPELEGRGHISRLIRVMEDHARALGFRRLTIGVEADSHRNRSIYRHWGYVNLILEPTEDPAVLYYGKDLV